MREKRKQRQSVRKTRALPASIETLLDKQQLAAIIGISTRTVERWLLTPGKLPEPLRLSTRRLRWTQKSVRDFFDGPEVQTA
jgi:predicted DNA-binding transcriptional regulator AlpA